MASGSVELAVRRYAAWAPGLAEPAEWVAWAGGARSIGGDGKPELGFVEPLLRRRLSGLSRMAIRVAEDCLAGDAAPDVYVFCSRYGEYGRSFAVLQEIDRNEPPSPMAFSMSVHNTASSLYAMARHDMSPSVSIASGKATLESGFIEAWARLRSGEAKSVLLVYHDEPLPDVYRSQKTSVRHAAAFGMLLASIDTAEPTLRLGLQWRRGSTPDTVEPVDPALEVLRLMCRCSGSFELRDGRLDWTWNASAPED
jgi:hypothetical protein